jgi:hypothetical protein
MQSPAELSPPQHAAVSIGGRAYMVVYAEIIRRAAAGPADEFDQGAEPGERLPLAGAHRRLGRSFHGGAGQELYDDPDSNRARFWRSYGVEVRIPNKLCLGTAFHSGAGVSVTSGVLTPARAPDAPGPFAVLAADGVTAYVYWFADTLRKSQAPDLVVNTAIATITACTSLAAFAGHVYIANGTELRRTPTSGTTSEQVTTQDCDLVGYANGHLLIGHDETIYELLDLASLPAAATALWTNPNTGNWTAIAETPGAIYAGYLGDNGQSAIYTWPDVADDTTLGVPLIAAPLNDYEQVYTMLCIGGRVLAIGTSEGLRLAVIGGDGSLDTGPILQPSGPDLNTPYAVEDQFRATGLAVIGDDLYAAGVRYSPAASLEGPAPLYRFDVGDFVGSLQPAWNRTAHFATEVVAMPHDSLYRRRSLAIWEHNYISGGGIHFSSLARLPILVDPTISQTVFVRNPTGWLRSGWITFGKPDRHQPIEIVVYHDTLPAGATIGINLVDDGGVSTALTGTTDGTNATTFDATGATPGRRFMVELALTRGTDTTQTPVVFGGWGYRAQVLTTPQDEIIVPVQLSREGAGQRRRSTLPMNPEAEYDFLKGLEGTVTTYVEGSRTERVQVASVGWERGDVRGMDVPRSDGASLEGTLRVRMVTVA